ncbi:MAG TPA: Hsp33 family molecular chaperone HslO [Pseudohongiella sp.]|nr:Hsp33 family molecular chaperone HslO [Gammaproteobacteria bacterium]HBN14951.1 Hsp33 family molecular chaperone HslO [Pseudohongiella sp.]|tara:strand:- start:41 stop:919 length:879 start_codon:yes stop_codon:yes gene_type:complete
MSNPAQIDTCQRFLFSQSDVRGEIVRLNKSYLDTVSNHAYPEGVRHLLGEFLAASVLLGSAIKYEGRLVLQVRGDGELSLIMSECTSEGAIRGIARFDSPPQSSEFTTLTGDGVLVITVDSRKREPYQGIVSLEGGSLSAALQTYFDQSEQLPSWFFFAVDGEQACGFMLQQLPGSSQQDEEDRDDAWQHLVTLAQTLTASELLQLDNEALLHRLYHQEQVELFEPRTFHYQCSCSRERTARALISIGKEEVDSIIAEHGAVNIACEFCGTEYQFDAAEVSMLMQERGNVLH